MNPTNTLKLLQRSQLLAKYTRALFVNPPAELEISTPNSGWCFYAHTSRVHSSGDALPNIQLSPFVTITPEVQAIFVFLPKEKSLTQFIFHQLAAQLSLLQHGSPSIPIYLIGANNEGIRSYTKKTISGLAPFAKLTSGNHCQILTTQRQSESTFSTDDVFQTQWLDCPLAPLAVTFMPGVFHENKLDPGTQFLLENLPKQVSGSVLDFGCGSGIISAWLCQHRNIQQLTASDLSVLATHATQRTLSICSNSPAILLTDGLTQINATFDWIITNPPFHQGKANNYQITTDFIQQAPKKLKPQGKLLMVANVFLPWPQQLESVFNAVSILARNKQFHIILASQPKV